MSTSLTAAALLDRDFLEIRHRLIDIAAAWDRIDRAADANAVRADPRITRIAEAVAVLTDDKPDRTRRVQMVFSEPYVKNWREP